MFEKWGREAVKSNYYQSTSVETQVCVQAFITLRIILQISLSRKTGGETKAATLAGHGDLGSVSPSLPEHPIWHCLPSFRSCSCTCQSHIHMHAHKHAHMSGTHMHAHTHMSATHMHPHTHVSHTHAHTYNVHTHTHTSVNFGQCCIQLRMYGLKRFKLFVVAFLLQRS